MTSSVYYRLLGQVVTLALHTGNSVVMILSMQDEELTKDQEIKNMISLMGRYLTVWNVGFQMAYFSLALACDFLSVTGRDNLIPKSIRRFRLSFFSSLVFPVAVTIFTVFWPIFVLKRDLLFPEFIDKIFSFKSNLVMHFVILPAVLWEMAFLPRSVPKSHRFNLGVIVNLYVFYVSFVFHTHSKRGLFPYPIFTMTYGTIYLPIFLLIVFLIGLGSYLLQWKLSALIWGQERKRKVKFS